LSTTHGAGEPQVQGSRAVAKCPLTIPKPNPGSKNKPTCQLVVTGIAAEFPTSNNSLDLPVTNTTLHGIHSELAEFGYVLREGDIIDAEQGYPQSSGTTSVPITVTYRNAQTKTSITKAARAKRVWNIPTNGAKKKGKAYSFRDVTQMRHKTKAELKDDCSHSVLIPTSGSRYDTPEPRDQLPAQTIPVLESAMDRRERKVEEDLREQERNLARYGPSATPMPSHHGDEWSPRETDVSPDLRVGLDAKKRTRYNVREGDAPDLRDKIIKRRVEMPQPDPGSDDGQVFYGPDTEETGGDFLPGFYCNCCVPNKHFEMHVDLTIHEQEQDSSRDPSLAEADKEEGELENQDPHNNLEPLFDQGECSSSSCEETQVYKVTHSSDEQDRHQSQSPDLWPRQWGRHSPQEARGGTLTPPSPLYLDDDAGHDHVSSTTDYRENRGPALENWEQIPHPIPDWEIALPQPVPLRNVLRPRPHSPIVFDSPVERTPVMERLGPRRSPERSQQHATTCFRDSRFDYNRLGHSTERNQQHDHPFDYNRLGQLDGSQEVPGVTSNCPQEETRQKDEDKENSEPEPTEPDAGGEEEEESQDQEIPIAPRGTCGDWSKWKRISPWLSCKDDRIPRCSAAENRSIWQPRQETDRYQRHAPEVTSNCPREETREKDEYKEMSEPKPTEPDVGGEEEEESQDQE
jgi:hypothetical protein